MAEAKELTITHTKVLALARVLQALQETQPVSALLEHLLGYLRAESAFDLVWLGLYQQAEGELVGIAGFADTPDPDLLRRRFVLNSGDLLEQVIVNRQPLKIPNLQAETRAGEWQKVAHRHQLQGALILPICHGNRCLGAGVFASHLWGDACRPQEQTCLTLVLSTLAATLAFQEENQNLRQAKRCDQPLLSLLAKLQGETTLQRRLDLVVTETHRFLFASRCHGYWFDPERQTLGRKASCPPRAKGERQQAGVEISLADLGTFRPSLMNNQVVVVGDLQYAAAQRLLQITGACTLLLAAVLHQGELAGLVVAESYEPRLWLEEEKKYLRGAADMLGLTVPLEEMESAITAATAEQDLVNTIVESVVQDQDHATTLRVVAEVLTEYLGVQRCLILRRQLNQRSFEIAHQTYVSGREPIAGPLAELGELDWHLLEESSTPVAVVSHGEDLELGSWGADLQALGVRSFLLCSTRPSLPIEGFVLVAREDNHSWSNHEAEVLQRVAHLLGLIIYQWQAEHLYDYRQYLNRQLEEGLEDLQKIVEVPELEQTALNILSRLTQAPLVTLVAWQSGHGLGQVKAWVGDASDLKVDGQTKITLHTDTLIQWALKHQGLLEVTGDQVAAGTRVWLCVPDQVRLLVAVLRTAPDHEPTGVVLIVDRAARVWPRDLRQAVDALVSQLAWSRRWLMLTGRLTDQVKTLKQMNWYKLRRLEELYLAAGNLVKRAQSNPEVGDAEAQLRRHQDLLRQLTETLVKFAPVLQQEQWQIYYHRESGVVLRMLKRVLDRVGNLAQQKQVWLEIHDLPQAAETGAVCLQGDLAKIELVLTEVLAVACRRTAAHGQVDLWPQVLEHQWLEISITDPGTVEPRLLEDLQGKTGQDPLAPSTLQQYPGLHLHICQGIVERMQGELSFHRLEDQRILTRLVLPLGEVSPEPSPPTPS